MVVVHPPRVLHTLPGRVRLCLSGWTDADRSAAMTCLRTLQGVRRVEAHALTGNMLIVYDTRVTTEGAIVAALWLLSSGGCAARPLPATTCDLRRRRQPPRSISPTQDVAAPHSIATQDVVVSPLAGDTSTERAVAQRGRQMRLALVPMIPRQRGASDQVMHDSGHGATVYQWASTRTTTTHVVTEAALLALRFVAGGGPLGLLVDGVEILHLIARVVSRIVARPPSRSRPTVPLCARCGYQEVLDA